MTATYYDYLIVGSGLYGSTFARLATDSGKRCLVIDKRPYAGGNVYCEQVAGINVHLYGPHIFHTSSRRVWNFVNRFVEFNRFTLMTMADNHGQLYNLPFNMNTFHQMWGVKTPKEARRKIEEQRLATCERLTKEVEGRRMLREPENLEEQALLLVGEDLYEALIRGYTEKQWGRDCKELPPFIIRRLPVRYTYDNNYFNDFFQGIPIGGYNRLTEGLLDGADLRLGVDFFDGLDQSWHDLARTLVYTGKIDDFYHHRLGHLQYRSLRFETEVLEETNHQGVAIMNYTDSETPYTRIIEHKHFETFGPEVEQNLRTVITREYPAEYKYGMEAYYPVNDETNTRLYQQYKALADKETDVIFGGRLAEYRYYDMAPVIESAMNRWDAAQLGQ